MMWVSVMSGDTTKSRCHSGDGITRNNDDTRHNDDDTTQDTTMIQHNKVGGQEGVGRSTSFPGEDSE